MAGKRERYTHSLLKGNNLVVSESVGFGDDGYQVDFSMQSTHKFNVDLLETVMTPQSYG